MTIKIPVSPGELIDKITILEIKLKQINDKKKLVAVSAEWKMLDKELNRIMKRSRISVKRIEALKNELSRINLNLWKIEDRIRKYESQKDFGKDFVINARSVYKQNDKRSKVKQNINVLFGSELAEVKQYEKY